MNKHFVIIIATVMIGFAVSETVVVTAQSNSTNSDRRTIIVTWLETNRITTDNTPMISISNEEFWKNFRPLLEQLNRRD